MATLKPQSNGPSYGRVDPQEVVKFWCWCGFGCGLSVTCHFPHHCGIGDFRSFWAFTVQSPTDFYNAVLSEMTDTDKVMNPQHFRTDHRQSSGSGSGCLDLNLGALLVDISTLAEFAMSAHILSLSWTSWYYYHNTMWRTAASLVSSVTWCNYN